VSSVRGKCWEWGRGVGWGGAPDGGLYNINDGKADGDGSYLHEYNAQLYDTLQRSEHPHTSPDKCSFYCDINLYKV
jgi:hypothetical protein